MWPPPGSCIKASPLMQPVAASPKGDLNTGVLLYMFLSRSSCDYAFFNLHTSRSKAKME